MLSKPVRRTDHSTSVYASECFPAYELIGYNYHAADIVFTAGFINVEEGRSPISRLFDPTDDELEDYLDICRWFQGEGASLYVQTSEKATLPIHYIADCVDLRLGDDGPPWSARLPITWDAAISSSAALLRSALTDTEHGDSCSCACAVGGCIPSTIFIRQVARSPDWRSDHPAAKLLNFLSPVASDEVKKKMHDILTLIFVRLCTFEELQITHTCRSHNVRSDICGKVEMCNVAGFSPSNSTSSIDWGSCL